MYQTLQDSQTSSTMVMDNHQRSSRPPHLLQVWKERTLGEGVPGGTGWSCSGRLEEGGQERAVETLIHSTPEIHGITPTTHKQDSNTHTQIICR